MENLKVLKKTFGGPNSQLLLLLVERVVRVKLIKRQQQQKHGPTVNKLLPRVGRCLKNFGTDLREYIDWCCFTKIEISCKLSETIHVDVSIEKNENWFCTYIGFYTHIGSSMSAIRNAHGLYVCSMSTLTKHAENAAARSVWWWKMF